MPGHGSQQGSPSVPLPPLALLNPAKAPSEPTLACPIVLPTSTSPLHDPATWLQDTDPDHSLAIWLTHPTKPQFQSSFLWAAFPSSPAETATAGVPMSISGLPGEEVSATSSCSPSNFCSPPPPYKTPRDVYCSVVYNWEIGKKDQCVGISPTGKLKQLKEPGYSKH